MLNPQASTFSVGDVTPSYPPDGRDRSSGVAAKKRSSGNVRVLADRGVASEDKSPVSIASQAAFAQSRESSRQRKSAIDDRSQTLPLTSGVRVNTRESDGKPLLKTSSLDHSLSYDKHKNIRLEQDRHNLMGVASIWAPRPSEKDLHAVYPVPVLSPTPRKPSEKVPSPRLSPTAPAFTSRSSPVWTGLASHPMLLTVPQFMQPAFVAPSLQHHDGHSGLRDDRSFFLSDSLMSQAWFCPMCENENRHNTETCAHCEALNPNRSLIRAISQQQQHAKTFQAYNPPGHFAMLPALSPQAKNLTSVSPMIIMSKLSCHVDAILKVGADGTKLQTILVGGGDVQLCYAMGMRGLIGKEAINPWKCVGVEIPSQNFIKNVSKPPLGTVAGDWTCSCGRENWAKRSVCSRCFPGIEPEYKSLVFSKVKPIFDLIAVQEQNGEAQKDAEWLAAEERRLRQGHAKQTQMHTQSISLPGPVIGKEFVADGRPLRQASRSPSTPNAYTHNSRPPHELPSQFLLYPQTYAVHQTVPPMATYGSIYPYPMIQPQSFQGYSRTPEEYPFQPTMQPSHYENYSSFQKVDIEPAHSIRATSSSRFSTVGSSESASESRFSPFSRSGSQHAIPKLGFTVTEASSAGSVHTAGTSSTGRSHPSAEGRHLDLPESVGNMSRVSEDGRREAGPNSSQLDPANPFSPFSQPQLFATQASQARHRSAKKAELRPTRSVSPIGQGQPESSVEDHAMPYPRPDALSATDSHDSTQNATYATEASYVNALGSLLKDVHF